VYSTALFVVWGGANDFEAMGSPTVAAANVDGYVQDLLNEGAKNILVPGLPNLGLTPEFYGASYATAYTDAFNQALLAAFPAGAKYVDTDTLLQEIVSNEAAYGFTNVTTPCLDTVAQTLCSDPDQHLFFDDIHPTTGADAYLAQDFINVAEAPEPSSMALVGTGMLGMAGIVRRRLAK
jgi:phospholipase/lecithinase/hemolysin